METSSDSSLKIAKQNDWLTEVVEILDFPLSKFLNIIWVGFGNLIVSRVETLHVHVDSYKIVKPSLYYFTTMITFILPAMFRKQLYFTKERRIPQEWCPRR